MKALTVKDVCVSTETALFKSLTSFVLLSFVTHQLSLMVFCSVLVPDHLLKLF